ncbi:MAG TPA: ABC transporter permease [Thermoanaerobaculia bacterium]|nr:ABC transporter permease [Thermoanaerobaculia bacterium]
MLGHYLKIAARHLVKHKGHSLINVLGLTLGMACCLLILLFLRHELSYDRSWADMDRIYRVTEDWQLHGQEPDFWSTSPPRLAPTLKEDMPEIEEAVRLFPYFEGGLPGRVAVSYGTDKLFYDRFYWADPGFFRIFTLPAVEGDADTALVEPNTVVLTASTARKYFGNESALGKVLRIDSGYSDEDYRVTAVVEDMPVNAHFHFEVLASTSTLDHIKDQRVLLSSWYLADCYTYIKLAKGVTPASVEAKLPEFLKKHLPPVRVDPPPKVGFSLQPLTDIHLHSKLNYEMEVNGDMSYIYIFSAIGALTLLIACVNFMNLATARFAGRAREVGVRKVVGAHRSQLITQFLGESLLLCILAVVLALVLVRLTLPAFNAFSGREIALQLDSTAWLGLLGLTLLVGLVAGSYPALFLSRFRPAQVLKSSLVGGVGSGAFRKVLIVFQFAVSVGLLIGAGIIYDQLRYMRSQELGIDIEEVVVLPIRDVRLRDTYVSLKEEIGRIPNVRGTTFSSLTVGRELPQMAMWLDGGKVTEDFGTLIVDYDFVELFDLPLVAGRNIAPGEDKDKDAAFLVNEAVVRHWGLSSPDQALGREVVWAGWKEGKIVGVVRDFHHRPLQFGYEPLIMHIRPLAFHFMYVRIAPENRGETLRSLESAWRRILPTKPFDYFFLDDEFERYYRAEQRLAQLVGFFAVLAVSVACLGLLGLASFTAEKRTREIGIRKVLGSSVSEVVLLLSRELALLVVVANLIAWPVAYLLMKDWLQGFPYRTDIHITNFVLGGLVALVIAWLTVSYQALKAALVDPAEALRYE